MVRVDAIQNDFKMQLAGFRQRPSLGPEER